MKGIKKLLIILFSIIGVLLISLSVVGFIFYDTTEGEYSYNQAEAKSVSTLVAEDLTESFNTIYNSSYKDNKITLSLSMKEMNDILSSILKENVNENYTASDEGVLFGTLSSASVKKLYFDSDGENLLLRADVGAIGFYKSNAKIVTTVSVDDDNKIIFDISAANIGRHNLTNKNVKNILKAVKNALDNESTSFIIVDEVNDKIKIDLRKLLDDNIENPILKQVVSALKYQISVVNQRVNLVVDTSALITGSKDIKKGNNNGLAEKFNSAIASLFSSYSEIVITESNFNYLIKSSLEKGFESLKSDIKMGEKTFKMSISDPYFDITTMSIMANLKINNIYTPINLGLKYNITYDKYSYADTIKFNVKDATLGEVLLDSIEGFEFEFSIKEALLKDYPLLILKDFAFNQENSTVVLTTVLAK